MLEVVASVVLAQAAQAVPDLAAGQHDFEAEGEVAGIAVAQHLHAAGVGRQVAADLAAAFRGQRQRKQSIGGAGGFLDGGKGAAGIDGNGVVLGVDRNYPVQAAQAHYHSPALAIRRRCAAQAGVAALGDDGRTGAGTGANDGGDFGGIAGTDDAAGRTFVAPAPVGQIGGQIDSLGQYVGVSDDAGQRCRQGFLGHRGLIP